MKEFFAQNSGLILGILGMICATVIPGIGSEEDFEGIDTSLVEAQAQPNGAFPTCEYPNPEEREALEQGIATCRERGADLLLATDPDADRVGVAVAHGNDYVLPTGNEMGVLLFDYLCTMRNKHNNMPDHPMVVSTIVSTSMIDPIADEFGVEVKRTLTGFKYIGDIITDLERKGEEERFLFGFEESYGYLPGTHVRDKDAISTSLLICRMAQYYASKGLDLVDALDALYRRYGHYANKTVNVAFPGADGAAKMKSMMERMRTETRTDFAGRGIVSKIDYATGVADLPKADVVEFALEGDAKVIFRPSGTEPKIKCYLFAREDSVESAMGTIAGLEQAARDWM